MASLYTRKNSPYIWLRWYDKNEPDPAKRRKSISTKILNNAKGWKEARELKKKIEVGLVEKEILIKAGIKIKRVYLSDVLEEYLKEKKLAVKTARVYVDSVKHFIDVNKNKIIELYNEKDYSRFISYMLNKRMKPTTQSIYCRHLSALWNYAIQKDYTKKNIIKKIAAPKKTVTVIPKNEMKIILDYFQKENINQYHLVKFLLLTGMRVSSALVQTWQDIDFNESVMIVTNVKAKGRKYYFPLHSELKELLNTIGNKKSGRIFHYWSEYPKFWHKKITKLYSDGLISKKYTLHDLRRTFTSWLINSGVDQAVLTKLLDHSDIRVTDESYSKFEMSLLKKQFKNVKFD